MTPLAALASASLVAFSLRAPEELLRRGYELLPDARWREELERDRASDFLGMVLSSPSRTNSSSPIDLGFTELDYDRKALYREEARSVRVDLELRAETRLWADFQEFYNWGVFRRHPSEPW